MTRLFRLIRLNLSLALVLLALAGCNDDNAKLKIVQSSKAAFSISTATLDGEYEKNQVAADEKYKDKVIAVSGVIDRIENRSGIGLTIYLASGNLHDNHIHCFFTDSEKESLANLSKGDSICVKGMCDGLTLGAVFLRGCVIQK